MKKRYWIVAVSAFVATYAACSSISLPIDGVVLEEKTNKPIPGVFVIAQWRHYGSDGYGSRTSCPHLEIVTTDENGRYRIPAVLSTAIANTQPVVFDYKAGYEWAGDNRQSDADVVAARKKRFMRVFAGTGDERVDSYRTYSSLRSCASGTPEEKLRKLTPLFLAIDQEAKTLVISPSNENERRGFKGALEDMKQYVEPKSQPGDKK